MTLPVQSLLYESERTRIPGTMVSSLVSGSFVTPVSIIALMDDIFSWIVPSLSV